MHFLPTTLPAHSIWTSKQPKTGILSPSAAVSSIQSADLSSCGPKHLRKWESVIAVTFDSERVRKGRAASLSSHLAPLHHATSVSTTPQCRAQRSAVTGAELCTWRETKPGPKLTAILPVAPLTSRILLFGLVLTTGLSWCLGP